MFDPMIFEKTLISHILTNVFPCETGEEQSTVAVLHYLIAKLSNCAWFQPVPIPAMPFLWVFISYARDRGAVDACLDGGTLEGEGQVMPGFE